MRETAATFAISNLQRLQRHQTMLVVLLSVQSDTLTAAVENTVDAFEMFVQRLQ